MDNSLSRWLQLREPADAVARSASLTRLIADALAGRESVRVLDLATGAGANLRYLAPHLPHRQHWLVADRDPTLLALLPGLTASWGAPRDYEVQTSANGFVVRGERLECHVEARQLDLGRAERAEKTLATSQGLGEISGAKSLAGSLTDTDIFEERHLVTASALLDLVSPGWLGGLAARCRTAGAAALFALTYNGLSSCTPSEPEDDVMRDLLNQHQIRDKGLGGLAAGPDAARCAVDVFTQAGYHVRAGPSDWSLGPAEHELQRQLIEGWAHVASEMGLDASTVASWRDRRIAHLEAGHSRIVVGHLDVAALPPTR